MKIDCRDVESIFKMYMDDTLHIFPSKDYNDIIREVRKLCKMK